MPFKNRVEAGQLLADQLKQLREGLKKKSVVLSGLNGLNEQNGQNDLNWLDSPILIALPRGGVPIAFEVAQSLDIPLEVLVVRKIGAPSNPEYGIGAITEDGFYWINQRAAAGVQATEADIKRTLKLEQDEVLRRVHLYRGARERIQIQGKTIIIVDDGLATGVTAKVAADYLKAQGAKEVILIMPVCSADTAQEFRSKGQTILCLEESNYFFSVGQFYEEFSQVSDEEVTYLLSKAHKNSLKGKNKPVKSPDELLSESPYESPYESSDKRNLELSEEVFISDPHPHKSDEQVELPGLLQIPINPVGIVLFAYESGSSQTSPQNKYIARLLHEAGFGTLLFDLLTPQEARDEQSVFNISLLAGRLRLATHFIKSLRLKDPLPIGYFGANTGSAAALWAAADLRNQISAIVSSGGRPDLARSRLTDVMAPTLLIVGSADEQVLNLNQAALPYLRNSYLTVIPDATDLFEEPGTLELAAQTAIRWFHSCFSQHKAREKSKRRAA